MYIFEISLFGIQIAPTWYGLMYAFGFIISYNFMKKTVPFRVDDIDKLLLYIFLGVIIGGRLGYVLFYNLDYFLVHPIEVFSVWRGGMSFHGGCIGVIVATYLFSYLRHYPFWNIIDQLAIIIPVALGLGRLGNYINGELPGYTPYTGYFPIIRDGVSHFPSPLLEMLLEGIILSIAMYIAWKRVGDLEHRGKDKSGILSAIFLIGYSIARLISEQFRLPDTHVGYLWGTDWITLGIVYTIPMFFLGIYIIASRKYAKMQI